MIDKLLNIIKDFFKEPCDHDWEVIDTMTTTSPLEIMVDMQKKSKDYEVKTGNTHEDLMAACTVKYICVVKCKGPCGELKKYVVANTGRKYV